MEQFTNMMNALISSALKKTTSCRSQIATENINTNNITLTPLKRPLCG